MKAPKPLSQIIERQMKLRIIITFLLLTIATCLYSCECQCEDDCSFLKISKTSKFVALVKVISYDNYLPDEILGYKRKMPQSMTVEIIKKYKGSETRQKIKIWGDNGNLCRPYIANFAIDDYFLIAPDSINGKRIGIEESTDYDFFSCSTDFLKVDMKTKIAFGEYTKEQDKISLEEFEKTMK
jgi:hypothetical protein